MSSRDYDTMRSLEDNWLETNDDGIEHFFCKHCEHEISEDDDEKYDGSCEECFEEFSECTECHTTINEHDFYAYDEKCKDCYDKIEEEHLEECKKD